jgi:flagellar hook-length control protein FliK
MILVSAKATSKEVSPISLNSSEEKKTTLSFADLLKGVNYKKDAKEELLQKQEGKSDSKAQGLLSLLKNEEATALGQFGLNPKITQNLTSSELKTLVSDAKKYLESQIRQTEGYKRSQIETLPKTLKGLVASAKELGIDLSKITLEEVRLRTQNSSLQHAKEVQERERDGLDKEGKNGAQDLRTTSLFKLQEAQAATTQQIVQLKQFKPEEKTAGEKAQDSLRALLRGDKESVQQASVATPLSVEAAKVLTANETPRPERTLESLLKAESSAASQNGENLVKTDGALKAESLEVKINEAKQMIKYLSSDIKQTIDEYKSPFTRVKLQLNPQRLGEVDVTVVQRGSNLHVNLSSNNAAINTLALHANELRQQLQNSGINNATFNFNNQSENGSASGGSQQQRQEQQGHKTYQALAQEENHEEILSSLEIVVPRYI